MKLVILLGFFFLLFFGTSLFALYVWWKKSIFTREKFAFAGLATASTLTVFVIASIFTQEPPWLAVIGLIKQALYLPYQPPQPLTIEQHILSILLVAGLWWLIVRLHSNWSGAQSTNQYEQQQKHQSPSLFSDVLLLLNAAQKRSLLAIYNPENQYLQTALEGAEESLVWHQQAKDLLQLSNRFYDFSDDEWHDQERCWIGVHKKTGDTVVLACCENQPEHAELQQLAEYADKVRRNNAQGHTEIEFIVALKEGDLDENSNLNEYPLHTISESQLLDKLVNFDDYFRDLRKRVEIDNLTGSELTIKQVYTVSSYKLEKESQTLPNLKGFLDNWLEETGLRQIALLGEYGQGKSTASLMYSYHLMLRIQENKNSTRIPILLELRGKSPRTLREDELLSTWAGRYGIDTRSLIKLLVAGRLLLIFEGFDEVDLSGDADARINHFKIMWGLCYPKSKIIVTGRPNYFLDDAELKAALGIQKVSLERPYCQAVYLAPFDFEEIEQSLRNLDVNVRTGIIDLAKVNERFYDIVSRPSMLHVVGTLWHRENLAQYGEQINSALVMDLFVRHSYERQVGKGQQYDFTPPGGGKAKPAFMALNIHERAYFMEGIATYMLVNQLPNQISSKQLETVVRLLIEALPEIVSLQADAQGGEARQPLRQRYDLENKPDEIQTILTDVRTCGLLVPDLSRSNSFKFGHKSFMEFLAGKVFAQWSLKHELSDIEQTSVSSLVNKLELKMFHVSKQIEVMAFAVEWIAEKAKDHNEAAKVIFALLFMQHNTVLKCIGAIAKLAVKCLSYTKNSDILFFAARLLISGVNMINLKSKHVSRFVKTYLIVVASCVGYFMLTTPNIALNIFSKISIAHIFIALMLIAVFMVITIRDAQL